MKYSLAIVMLLACASLVQAEPGNGNAYGKAHAPGQNKAPGEPAQGHAHGKTSKKLAIPTPPRATQVVPRRVPIGGSTTALVRRYRPAH